MKTQNSLFAILWIFIFFSCNHTNNKNANAYSLVGSDKYLSFSLNSNTKSDINALFLYIDDSGKEYLTFQNPSQNEILFYNPNTEKLEFTIRPHVEGNNGVGFFNGYYIHNLDSIYITNSGLSEFAIIDRNAIVKDKIQYFESTEGIPLSAHASTTFLHQPIVVIDNKIYIIPSCNRLEEKNPVCAVIDIMTHNVQALLGFTYPTFPGADNKAKRYGVEGYLSRCFDGKQFVYSFYFDENIYVAPPNHGHVKLVKVKSNYLKEVKIPDDYGNVTMEKLCENPNYGNLLYDEYRDVYYRIAYPETELEKNIRGTELLRYGRKSFSVIIIDKYFNIIGETLLPNYTYNSQVMFIREDGLYISSSHYLNPKYSDDVLSFQRFDLVKN
ncbi:MAG: DUF4221 domain-containing protein [Tannerellaceae bacterium]|jgi:hypothetical protein|nr:DUF4221 domain-containing protein [Tannerellaceae bacterium]